MRIPQPGGDVEPEVRTVLYHVLPQPHIAHPALLEGLLEQQWLQQRVQFFSNILQQDWSPELDAVLQSAGVVGVRELYD